MKDKRIFLSFLCGVGGGLMGFSVGRLNSAFGAVLFTVGAAVLAFSVVRLKK